MENNDSIFAELNPEETEVGLTQGFLVRIIDLAVEILILALIYKFMPWDMILSIINISSIMVLLIIMLVTVVYQFLFLVLFNKTLGMMICKVKLLNKDLQPLSVKEKFVSVFRTRFSRIKYYKA
jgi:uncharacterized RDD family membrane protein YckC